MSSTARDRVTAAGALLLTGGAAAALGWFAPQYPGLALVAGLGVLLLGISALQPVAVPLLALPLLYVAARVVYGGTDISVSDVALAIGTLCALLFVRHPISAPGRNLLWLVAIYQSATLFTVVANPYLANTLDWARSGLLIAGGLILGWSVGRSGMGGVGLKLMLAAALVLATWTIVVGVLQALQGDFRPVYLQPGMHKNFLGTVMGITALIAYVRPAWANLSRRAGVTAFWWLAIGIGFTQSRQAVVALGVALIVLVLRSRTDRRRSKVILLGIVPALVVVFTLVRDQVSSDNVHNSVFQRLTWFQDAIDIWQTSPIVGVGLRWWYTDRFPGGFQPPNAELEVLTSAGILGLLGFLVLMVGTIVVLWKLPPAYGTLAVLAVLSRFVQGQLDLFWVAAQTSIPFVIAGICLGALARREHEDAEQAALGDLPLPTAEQTTGVAGARV
ncbi:O-antigen ligase family protein [Janibacter limosus]|jgi:hypothetical protein|uniref:O-antigen ligase domain-containing protein n=1 Tax=Janibacter limosus TaxID=53458 RepID=A0A4P6MR85_9MICO|nr:O-antigen ligase family protein [Janibacter limosus]QBF45276.1 O-antigen ligase domain-containing protein [Janibacter limosus]